jgi:NAD(P)-dependent dehydrogenase (short-subunit alcohol dehydrogenase family)
MAEQTGSIVIVGGTHGIGLELARWYVDAGRDVVITGRDAGRATSAAAELGGKATSAAFDLSRPDEIAAALADVQGPVQHLALVAIQRDVNTVAEYDLGKALVLVTLKLVGYTEVIHALRSRLAPDASIVIFGGLAKDAPYPGSVTVTSVNGGVLGMVNTLVVELKPIRVNAIHPGFVLDSPYWAGNDAVVQRVTARTPTGRGVTMADIVHACAFLFENPSVNGVNLDVNGGYLLG